MKYKILLLIILLLAPISVLAKEEVSIQCTGDKEEFVCTFASLFDYPISAIDFHYEVPEYAKITATSVDESWEGSMEDKWFSLYSERDYTGFKKLGTITLKSSKELKESDIIIKDLKVYDSFFQEHLISTSVNIPKKERSIIKFIIPCVIILIGIVSIIWIIKRRSNKHEKI